MLEAHHRNTYGEDSDSTSSEASQEETELPDTDGDIQTTCTAMELPGDLEGSVQEAISILKEHKTFLHKQQVLVKRHCERTACLPRAISSKGRVEEVASTTERSSPTRNSGGQRRATQADKNRKRKLKKKRAKEKRQKVDQTNMTDHIV